MTSSIGHAATTKSVEIKIDDLREVVAYTSAIEAENKQYKQSLESERKAIEDLIVKQEELIKKYDEQITALNKRNKKTERVSTIKTILLVGAGAAIAVIASR